jgi:hypothetical protein
MQNAEPTIAIPQSVTKPVRPFLAPKKPASRRVKRYVPPRGLVRRLTEARNDDAIDAFLSDHHFDTATGNILRAELVKAGAPPLGQTTTAIALERMLGFEPLNADALRPFVILAAERSLRAEAMNRIGHVMERAGRTIRLYSDAADSQSNPTLASAAKQLGHGVIDYNGSPDCAQTLRNAESGCLNLVESGYRAPLDKVALLRLGTLVTAIDAEPIMVMRPQDCAATEMLAPIGVKRIILALTDGDATLGPAIATLRRAGLALAEIIDLRDEASGLTPATPAALAKHLLA